MLRLLAVAAVAVPMFACSNLVVIRGSTNDFLKRKATSVTLNTPLQQVQPVLDELMLQRGFRPTSNSAGEKGAQLIIYRGSRPVPPDIQAYGIQLGSWFAARIAVDPASPNATEVTLMGKPMVGTLELCSDHDKLLSDIQYTCQDTKVPPDWAAKNLVSGRDETEVVSWVLTGLYERLRH